MRNRGDKSHASAPTVRKGALSLAAALMAALGAAGAERQITDAPRDHVLTNINCWSRDGRWIAFDTRTADGSSFDCNRIEIVDTMTGALRELYRAQNGAGCGVVTFDPASDRVAFILGPETPDSDWSYAATRRRGVIVRLASPGVAHPLDAMNYAPPFVPGALRGGSHVHVFSPDGRWISFTYDDEVLARLDASAPGSPPHDRNQRNIAVAMPLPVGAALKVARSHPRNNDGAFFCAVVTRTVNSPSPGSDEISRAFEEGWIGTDGYARADGSRQRRALAFQGLVTTRDGREHAEVFVVDLPDNISGSPPACGTPLEGSATLRLVPPGGVTQRRITFTDGRKFPGLAPAPRHWLRSSPDGSQIAFLMRDDAGVVQLFTVPALGGAPRQLTNCRQSGIASAFTWSPDGRTIAAVIDGSVCVIDAQTGEVTRITPRRAGGDAPSALACVFSPDGARIAYTRRIMYSDNEYSQIFTVDAQVP